MSISDKHIKLRKLFEVAALNNRATARKLVKRIKKIDENTIILDFTDIDFASRSFIDELNAHLLQIDKKVKKANMNLFVTKMDKLVQKSKNHPEREFRDSKTDSEPELLTF